MYKFKLTLAAMLAGLFIVSTPYVTSRQLESAPYRPPWHHQVTGAESSVRFEIAVADFICPTDCALTEPGEAPTSRRYKIWFYTINATRSRHWTLSHTLSV